MVHFPKNTSMDVFTDKGHHFLELMDQSQDTTRMRSCYTYAEANFCPDNVLDMSLTASPTKSPETSGEFLFGKIYSEKVFRVGFFSWLRTRIHDRFKRLSRWKLNNLIRYGSYSISARFCLIFLCQWLLLSWISPVIDAAVFTSDPRYRLWPNPARIPYQIEINNINSQDFTTLMAAMAQISSDTGQCVQFVPYDATIDRSTDFVLFRNRLTTGIIDICYTFPGLVTNNGFGQVAVVFGSNSWPGNNATGASSPLGSGTTIGSPSLPGACLDSQRDTMRLLLNILGVRNEHNRNDRNSFLIFQSTDPNTLVTPTLQKYNIFTAYANNSVATIASTFDYNSVTLVTGQQYAASTNFPVFYPASTNTIGQLPRLSRTDCLLMNLLYRCSSPCPDPYATSGQVTWGTPTTFFKHVYCPPLIQSSFLTTPLVIGDVYITNAPGVQFRYTITPQVSYLSVFSTTKTVGRNEYPAGRISLTQIPSKGFVNGQFTITAISTSGGLQGSIVVTLTINCVPNFVSSYGGRPSFTQPNSIGQPSTSALDLAAVTDVFFISIGSVGNPGIYVNCRGEDTTNDAGVQLPSCIGYVTAADPEGGRVSYYISSPFEDHDFNRKYVVTPDGVICFGNNNETPPGTAPDQFPYGSGNARTENIYVGAVDPVGGMSVIHYQIFTQCAPNGG